MEENAKALVSATELFSQDFFSLEQKQSGLVFETKPIAGYPCERNDT